MLLSFWIILRIILTPITFPSEQICIMLEELGHGKLLGAAQLHVSIMALGAFAVWHARGNSQSTAVMGISWILSMAAYSADYLLIRRSEQSKIAGSLASIICSVCLAILFGTLI